MIAPRWSLLLLLAAALQIHAQDPVPLLRLGLLQAEESPRFFRDDNGEWTGFELGLIEALSNSTGLGFEWVWLPTPQDRVDALVNDTVDFVVAGLGATTAREELVDFVLPAYHTEPESEPWAIAVAQGDTEFAQKLGAGLLQLFWNGATSPIQELEQKWFGAGGLPPNEAVAKLVEDLKAGKPADTTGPLYTLYESSSS